jgi:exosome complex RNA-binding protein Rrp4
MKSAVIEPKKVVAGDNVTDFATESGLDVELGRGISIHSRNDHYICLSEGTGSIHATNPSYICLESSSRIYIPQVGDKVIGVIDDRGTDFYRVNIFSTTPAILNRLGFDGATKRNKPEFKSGDLVYASIVSSDSNLDVEITCITESGLRKDWSSGDSVSVL